MQTSLYRVYHKDHVASPVVVCVGDKAAAEDYAATYAADLTNDMDESALAAKFGSDWRVYDNSGLQHVVSIKVVPTAKIIEL